MYRDNIENIDIVWGKEGYPANNYKGGYGLSHIIAHRNYHGFNGEEIAKKMPDVIMNGKVIRDSQYKATIDTGG